MVEDYIPRLVDDRMNTLLTMLPSPEELLLMCFPLTTTMRLGHMILGRPFFISIGIIKQDVSKTMIQFLSSCWILPSFNSITLVLILKSVMRSL